MTHPRSVSTKSVPPLARTDVRPVVPAMPDRRRRTAGRAVAIGVAVLAAAALLALGVVFALRHELLDPAFLDAGILNVWR